MYVNAKRIEVSVATPLTDNDEICFGSKVPNNELKYRFFSRDGKALLERSTESFVERCLSPQCSKQPDTAGAKSCAVSDDRECTPPLVRTHEDVVRERPLARKKLKLDPSGVSVNPAFSTILSPTPPLPSSANFQTSKSSTSITIPSTVLSPTCPLPSINLPLSSETPKFTASSTETMQFHLDSTNPPIISSQSSQEFTHHSTISQSTATTSEPQVSSYQVVPSTLVTTQTSSSQGATKLTPLLVSASTLERHSQDGNVPIKSSVCRFGEAPTAKTTPGVPLVACDVNPSPALSTFSTKSTDREVEDLFDDIVSNSDDRLLDEAIFGESSTQPVSTALPMDGATIQVLAVQEQMQQEKQKLLSSIEALKR